ncbi:MAG TPA: tryptophan synthase subunit beta, partial [Tepidisphaeraceae bacterium]|nr:tryptophan synthase subunit beta [Tepidisphaeraceae bacterium]
MSIAPVASPKLPGRFGPYGGIFVPETLVAALQQLDAEYRSARADPKFNAEFDRLLREFVGRPSRFY